MVPLVFIHALIGPLLGLPPALWTLSQSATMRWEVCEENEEKALHH